MPNQASRILEAKEVCASYGIPVLNSITHSRNIYDDSEENGKSVIEIEPDGKAALEIKAIVDELLTMEVVHGHEFN